MDRIKRAIQHVTWLTIIALGLAMAFVLAKIVQLFNGWTAIDSLYPIMDRDTFRLIYFLSRIAYGFIIIASLLWLADLGEKAGFFWFKLPQESERTREKSVDWSGYIVGFALLVIVILLVIVVSSEIIIRLATGTIPPSPLDFKPG